MASLANSAMLLRKHDNFAQTLSGNRNTHTRAHTHTHTHTHTQPFGTHFIAIREADSMSSFRRTLSLETREMKSLPLPAMPGPIPASESL